jgi:hypothetical protein
MKKKIEKFFPLAVSGLLFALAFGLSCMSAARTAAAAASAPAAAPIAEVLTMVPGASVNRGGQTLPLEKLSPLRVSDTVSTDASGRLRILFADDSTVDLGANSSLDLRDFADSGAASVFNVHLLQGVARVVTGKIVEQNPQGFAVSTPEGTIGIRGTILSLRTDNGTTTVYVENTTRAVYVNNINVPGGQKITIPGDPVRPEPILPQDRRNLGRELAFRGGTGVAAAAPEPFEDGFTAETRLLPGAPNRLVPADTSLADIAPGAPDLGASLMAGGGGGGGGGGLMASIDGNLFGTYTIMYYFYFDVNLATGDITGAILNGSGYTTDVLGYNSLDVSLSGGTGSATASYFMVNTGFTGTVLWGGSPITPNVVISGANTLTDFNADPSGTVYSPINMSIMDASLNDYDHAISGSGTLTK